jgi:nitroreductase
MDVHEAIRCRRSVRSYKGEPIDAGALERLRAAVRAAPSACNFQPWHFVFTFDAALRRRLAGASNDQFWMAAAPLIVTACGLADQAYRHMGGRHTSIEIDVAIAIDHLTLAAVAEGLGTCWIGAFDEERVRAVLEIPATVRVVALTPVGVPSSADLIRPLDAGARKPAEAVFSAERWSGEVE